ncbi:MAG: Crp/Fnr family transcriptional regulator [Sphingomonas sp.]|nr:Crp/Fnr family transcriptional regulator [Sphingomonas sp.]
MFTSEATIESSAAPVATRCFVPIETHPPANPLIEKLGKFATLSGQERDALDRLCRSRKKLGLGETLVREGCRSSFVFLILKGVAVRYRYLSNGKRQIMGYLLPGDLCDAHFLVRNYLDHDISLLTDAEVAVLPIHELTSVMAAFPTVRQALLETMVTDRAMLREWLLNVGQRNARQKLAHFICEISQRMQSLGQVNPDGSYSIPLTQVELADTMGLTVVHVSRCLQRFRAEGLVYWSRQQLTILDVQGLRQLGGFDQGYLHIGLEPASRCGTGGEVGPRSLVAA